MARVSVSVAHTKVIRGAPPQFGQLLVVRLTNVWIDSLSIEMFDL